MGAMLLITDERAQTEDQGTKIILEWDLNFGESTQESRKQAAKEE